MKKDIENKDDLRRLINTFYEKVRRNEVIGYIFNMVVHKALNEKHPLKPEHFKEWLKLFNQTTDELFEGLNADIIKQRAQSIAMVMQMKIAGSSRP